MASSRVGSRGRGGEGVSVRGFPRVVLGYHGCDPAFADGLISGDIPIADWRPSRNPYDWLGDGIYFWEHAPARAREWGQGGVVGAVLQLGLCLDLTDTAYTQLLELTHNKLRATYLAQKRRLPQNRGKRRELDQLVINELVAQADAQIGAFQSVRCPFLEGEPAFPGSAILRESHIQIAVRDRDCIAGVYRPNVT
jgi:hypothetical protein